MRIAMLLVLWGSFSLGVMPCRAQDEPAAEPSAETAPPEEVKATVAAITIRGLLPESAGQIGLFGELEENLGEMVRRLDRAAQDDKLAAVVLSIRNPTVGRGKLHELRQAIGRVRAAGKKVIAELEGATSADYLLACACDEIVMPESGALMIPGVRAEVTFYRGLFDKLGIEADMMQVGDFKGAAEPYTREKMSDQFRRQYESLLDDVYEQLVSTIAADRELEADKVRSLIDVGLFTPAAALEAGLIDRVSYRDQLDANLQQTLAANQLEMVKNYGKKKVDNDFSGMLGMMKLFELMMGVEPAKRGSSRKKVAVIYASGIIMPGKSSTSMFGGEILGSETLVKAIRQAADDKTVVAIVLRVDSPGGSSLASDLIWRAVQQCEKPILASMGDVAASGGYYISMGCDKIYAEPGTLTGSIGVVGGKLVLKGLFNKVGVTTDVISRGRNSGLLSSDAPFTDSEREAFKEMMEMVYEQFVGKAAAGRQMKVDDMKPLAGGRVWTGRQAQQNGLVDELGTLRDAIADAKKMAGIEADEKVELLILPKPVNFLDQLLGIDTEVQGRVEKQLRELAAPWGRLAERVPLLVRLFSEPTLYLVPYAVEIR